MRYYKARFKNDYGRKVTMTIRARNIVEAGRIAEKQRQQYSRRYKANATLTSLKHSPASRISEAKRDRMIQEGSHFLSTLISGW